MANSLARASMLEPATEKQKLVFIIVLFGIILGYTLIFDLPEVLDSADWKQTQATVDWVSITQVGDQKHLSYHGRLGYSYIVDGYLYHSNSLEDGRETRIFANFEQANHFVEEFHKGKKLDIYYSPKVPSQSSFSNGPSVNFVVQLGFSAVALIWAFFHLIGLSRKR